MKIKKIGKKGITFRFLITLIILILGFTILLFFYFQIGWTGRIDREICHQSVIYRATLPEFAGAREYVPLKCKTEKICITSGFIGGDCVEFENAKGVSKFKANSLEQIEQFMAREMVECWEIMGQGKIQIFGNWFVEKYSFGTIGSSCVLCSRIAFDKQGLEEAGIDLEELDVMKYMQTHEMPNKDISYYTYLAGGGGELSVKGGLEIGDISELDEFEKQEIKDTLEDNEIDPEIIDESIELEDSLESEGSIYDEQTIMFMQVTAPGHAESFQNLFKAGATILGLSAIYRPGAFITSVTVKNPIIRNSLGQFAKGTGKIVTKTGATALAKIVAVVAIATVAVQQVNVATNQNIAAGYCGDVSLGNDAREGCSVVRAIPYNVEELTNYCTIIESIS